MFENIYGLSCVENQVLSVLREQGMNITPLYYDSIRPFQDKISFFTKHDKGIEYFDIIPRIQNVLKKLGVITLSIVEQKSVKDLCLHLDNISKEKSNTHLFIRCKPSFVKNELHARGWRDDHYVRIRISDNGYEIINDIPEKVLVVTESELSMAYDGSYLEMNVLRSLNDANKSFLWNARQYKPEDYEPLPFDVNTLLENPNIGLQLRNLAGVNKILYHRLERYYKNYINTEFMQEKLIQSNNFFAMLEYYNLRKNTSFAAYKTLLSQMDECESSIISELKERLLNYEHFKRISE